MKVQCTRKNISDTVRIKEQISALRFLSPTEVRKLQMFREKGEEAFFVSIPKPWFRVWGKPEEVGIQYISTENPKRLLLFNKHEEDKTILKKIGSSYFFKVDSSFVGGILPGVNVLLEHFGSYLEVIFPNKFIEKHELVYCHKTGLDLDLMK